jgi:hypothetical protein
MPTASTHVFPAAGSAANDSAADRSTHKIAFTSLTIAELSLYNPEMIRKGDHLQIPGATEPMVASRDEYDRRVWVVSESEFAQQQKPGAPRVKEQPYLVLPDRSLVRDFQHGFPDDKFDK